MVILWTMNVIKDPKHLRCLLFYHQTSLKRGREDHCSTEHLPALCLWGSGWDTPRWETVPGCWAPRWPALDKEGTEQNGGSWGACPEGLCGMSMDTWNPDALKAPSPRETAHPIVHQRSTQEEPEWLCSISNWSLLTKTIDRLYALKLYQDETPTQSVYYNWQDEKVMGLFCSDLHGNPFFFLTEQRFESWDRRKVRDSR